MARWLTVCSLLVALSAVTAESSLPPGTEAVVNGQPITTEDVDIAFSRTSVSKQQLDESQKRMYRAHVLNVLIDNLLLKQFLTHEGIQPDTKAVEAHLNEFKANLSKKGESLESFLQAAGASEERMKQEVADVYQWLSYLEEQSSEKNLRDYFTANKAAFDGSQVRASHILVEFPPQATSEEKEQARKKIQQIQAQLAAGTDFADLAREHSDCQSKAQGGDVGYFTRKGQMTEAFAQKAFDLQTGQVSEIVETEYGFHLIKCTDRKQGKSVLFQSVKDDVKGHFAGDLRLTIIQAMRKQADIQWNRPAVAKTETPESRK